MKEQKTFDAIIIGAGSVGTPTAMYLSEKGLKVLVLEKEASTGQGQNKRAIGGVRATHSDPAKIALCKRAREVFDSWQEKIGDDICWKKGGYCYPVYEESHETLLKSFLPIQKKLNLKIDWVDAPAIRELIPGINDEGLRGGTWSPDDGQASPLAVSVAMQRRAQALGAKFLFKEEVTAIDLDTHGAIKSVSTAKNKYATKIVVNAAGAGARFIGSLTKTDLPVFPDCHEAGISAPVQQFLGPLVVDIRRGPDGKTENFYFGQNEMGQIIFCYTPLPSIIGTNINGTSDFLPIIARRLITLVPRFKDLVIRRTWRGLYPNTPDGIPIIDKVREVEGLYVAVGMCGQGFMMGPGVGINMASLIVNGKPDMDEELFKCFTLYGDFYKGSKEALK